MASAACPFCRETVAPRQRFCEACGRPLGIGDRPVRRSRSRTLGAVVVAALLVGATGAAAAAALPTLRPTPGTAPRSVPPSDVDPPGRESVEESEAVDDIAAPREDEAVRHDDEGDADVEELAAIDWTTLPWTTACTDEGDLADVTVGPPPHGEAITGEDGTLEHHSSRDSVAGIVYSVHLGDAVYGDVTGDGHDDGVFRTSCFWGNDFTWSVEVWSHGPDGKPTHLPPVLELTKFDGQIDGIDIVDGALRVRTREAAETESHPHLNGYGVEVVTDWRYESQRWRSTGVSRDEAGDDSADAIGDCPDDPVRVSGEQAARCLYEAWTLADRELALVYASSEAVDELLRYEWVPSGWDWDGCLEDEGAVSCWWYEPSEDPRYHGVALEMRLGEDAVGSYVEWIDFYG